MTKRKQRAMLTKEKIIQKGGDLIEAKGFDNVPVDDIVSACDLAKGTFYHHFKSKYDIISLVETQAHAKISEAVTSARGQRVAKRLYLFSSLWVEAAIQMGMGLTRQIIKHCADPSFLESCQEESPFRFFDNEVRRIIADAIAEGELVPDTPSDTLIKLYMCQLYGSVLCWCMYDGGFSMTEWLQTFSHMIVNTVLKTYYTKKKLHKKNHHE
jgi:AcrR family transcriptional regulator